MSLFFVNFGYDWYYILSLFAKNFEQNKNKILILPKVNKNRRIQKKKKLM